MAQMATSTVVSNPGTAPNYCSVEYNLWFLPGEIHLRTCATKSRTSSAPSARPTPGYGEHPPRFTWKLRDIYFPPAETSPDHPFIQSLSDALQASGQEQNRSLYRRLGAARRYAERGISGAIFGPGRIAQAHSPDEYVEINQLRAACACMALAATAWCGLTSD